MDKLIAFLDQQGIEYEIIEHRQQINTAQEGADFFGIHIGQTAPTLILKTDNGFFALIISGDFGRVDFEPLKALLQVQQIKLAKPPEVEAVTGSKTGSVSLIQQHLPAIIDRGLYRFDYVYGGTGFPNTTLKIRPNDLEKLVKTIAYIR